MNARKPADPRDEVQITSALRDSEEGTGRRRDAEEPLSPDPDEPRLEDEEIEQHENVEVEIGPVDREEGDDPLPQAP